jgi:ankyrin repeat protein
VSAQEKLVEAALDGDAQELSAAILAGADPLLKNEYGESAMMIAIQHGYKDCVRVLLPVSDAKDTDTDGWTPLMLAATHGHAECVRLLIQGSDACATNKYGETPLMIAAINGHAECVRLLLPVSNSKQKDVHGLTASKLALDAGHAECVAIIDEYVEAMRQEKLLDVHLRQTTQSAEDLRCCDNELKASKPRSCL